MAKNLISGPILDCLAQIWVPNIVASYHWMQLQGKGMIQTQENGEKTRFEPD